MADYNVSRLIAPQFIAAGTPAEIVFSPPGAGNSVPANTKYKLSQPRITNVSGTPQKVWVYLVPSGSAVDAQHNIIPNTVVIPAATNTFPQFDLTALWGATLNAGDKIYMQAETASSLIVYGDGTVVV